MHGLIGSVPTQGSTIEAIQVFEADRKGNKLNDNSYIYYAPGKAANAGGVAVSGLEMQQNAYFNKWTAEVVDAKLKQIMADTFKQCFETALEFTEEGQAPSLVDGANLAGFLKVANAMKEQGDVW